MFRQFCVACALALASSALADVADKDCAGLKQSNKLQILSSGFVKNGDVLKSSSTVLLIKPDYYARANSAIYDTKTGLLTLEGDVFINNHNQNSLSQKAVIKINSTEARFSDFFVSNSFLELWLSAKSSEYKNDKFLVNKSIVSSCAINDPEWQIDFSSGVYDNKTKDLVLKNMVFKYHKLPLFWLPYFKINTDEARKSGLLTPRLAYKSKEGFYYEQPYFWAISHAADLELRAQIRSARGMGLYTRARWADSAYSKLSVDLGYFKEFGNYASKEQLKYKEHYGFGVHYERSKLLKQNPAHQEGLYLNYLRINDIDFLNLSSFMAKSDDYLITSKLNYFYTDNQDFIGAYAKLYQDTTQASQANTIQELPSLQYHRFYDSIGPLKYRFDTVFSNYYRQEGSKISIMRSDLPLSIQKAFNQGLFNIELKQQFQSFVLSKKLDDEQFYYRSLSSLVLHTNLFKNYSSFTHSIDASLAFGYKSSKELVLNEFYMPAAIQEGFNMQAKIDQKFSNDFASLRHSLSLNTKAFHPYELESDISYEQNSFRLWNNLRLNLKTSQLERFFMNAEYFNKSFTLNTGFYYNKRFDFNEMLDDNKIIERYVKTGFKINLNEANSIYANGYYDLNSHRYENYAIGFVHKRRCINYTLEFRQFNSSKLTQSGVKSSKDRGIYLRFNLYPIGGVKYNFALGEQSDL